MGCMRCLDMECVMKNMSLGYKAMCVRIFKHERVRPEVHLLMLIQIAYVSCRVRDIILS